MELNFIKDNNKYVSEFEVSSDFNLHIERAEGGTLYIQQRTGNGQYDTVKDAVFKLGDSVIDYDFQALVYPKYIKIVSDINPIAYVTSDGEVTEIKSQTKEVEVTANGTTQVAPDAGFSYLTGVSIKTNVPQSGGSGGSEGGGSNVVYLNMEPVVSAMGEQFAAVIKMLPGILAIKLVDDYMTSIAPVSAINDSYFNQTKAAAILPNFRGLIKQTNDLNSDGTIDGFKQLGATEITKEEFYNLG